MSNTSREFNTLIKTLLKNRLTNFGYAFKSNEEFDSFIESNIYIVFSEETNLQQFYVGKPNKKGILLFTYRMT
jgi:hypothetical protein